MQKIHLYSGNKPNNFICLVIFVLLFSVQPMYAQLTKTATWQGNNSSNWDDPGNWSTGEVPDVNTLAIIPEDCSSDPVISDNATAVGGIQIQDNASININNADIVTGSIVNNGTIMVEGDVSFQGWNADDPMSFTSSGSISTTNDLQNQSLNLTNVSTFTNTGDMNVEDINTKNVNTFTNGNGGSIHSSAVIRINCQNFLQGEDAKMDGVSVIISAGYAYLNGVMEAIFNLTVNAKKDYIKVGGKAKLHSSNKLDINGYKSLLRGDMTNGLSLSKTSAFDNQSSNTTGFEMAVEMGWVVGDTVRVESESIRFVFDQLSFFSLDSIKQIHAASKIEFFGTEGSILDLQYNESDSIFYVDDGTIEIHCDSILYDGEDINDLFQPNPIIGPPDLSLKQAYISSASAIDTTGNSGEFKIDIRNHSTAAQVFDYRIASAKGWVQSATGSTVELQPFQYDSLMVQYTIPANADTLPDTVSVSLSVPGEYNETVCSYIMPIVTSQTSVKSPDKKPEQFQLAQNYPNPFNPATSIRFRVVRDGHFSLKVYNVRGEQAVVLLDGHCQAGTHKVVFDALSLPSGIYFYRLEGAEINIVRKMMLLK